MKSWVDHYFAVLGDNLVLSSLSLGVGTFVVGLLISFPIGFAGTYLRTLSNYVAIFGISWVALCARWGSKKVQNVFPRIRPAFDVGRRGKYFDKLVHISLKRIFNTRQHIVIAVIGVILAWTYVPLLATLGGIPWLPRAWSLEPYLWVKILILDIYLIPVVFLLTTTAFAIALYMQTVAQIARLRPIPLIEAAREYLHPIVDFSIMVGLAWSVGVSIVVWFFYSAFDAFAIVVVVIVSVFAFLTILWPQYALHKALDRTKRELIDASLDVIRLELDERRFSTRKAMFEVLHSFDHSGVLGDLRSAADARTWMYNPQDVGILLGTWVLPVISVFLARVVAMK